jgi:signal transduction histidine kinase
MKLCRLAALGRLLNGLAHNLNGPLQNLSMEMEILRSRIGPAGSTSDIFAETLRSRILSMEEELEQINALIKTISMRANMDFSQETHMTLGDFFHQELLFLRANLYFKHHIHPNLELDLNLPPLRSLSKHIPLALGWLMQAMLEELESARVKGFRLRATVSENVVRIEFFVEGKALSEILPDSLALDAPSSKPLRVEYHGTGLAFAMTLLKTLGVSLAGFVKTSGSEIVLEIPVYT